MTDRRPDEPAIDFLYRMCAPTATPTPNELRKRICNARITVTPDMAAFDRIRAQLAKDGCPMPPREDSTNA